MHCVIAQQARISAGCRPPAPWPAQSGARHYPDHGSDLKKPANNSTKQAVALVQGCLSAMPTIVLGSGHSAAFGLPGMTELRDHLLAHVPPPAAPDDLKTWHKFEAAVRTMPLEAALHQVHLGPDLMNAVVRETWNCCFWRDRELLEAVARGATELPLSRLFRHLFRSTHGRLAVVTTNYDRIAEYAADDAGYGWAAGFGLGYLGQRHLGSRVSIQINGQALRMVDIFKVHGSLDWFARGDGTMLSLPALTSPPAGFAPLIVAPGGDKYKRAYEEPFRTSIVGADSALRAGKSYLCIGYGFNDEHIQPVLLDECRRQDKLIVVMAKCLTDAARSVLLDGRCRHVCAFEESAGGTRMYNADNLAGVELAGINLWSLAECLDLAI